MQFTDRDTVAIVMYMKPIDKELAQNEGLSGVQTRNGDSCLALKFDEGLEQVGMLPLLLVSQLDIIMLSAVSFLLIKTLIKQNHFVELNLNIYN